MSDKEVTQETPDPDGLRCPAAAPLCVCGVRGCPSSKAHRRQMTTSTRRRHRI
jgi:hypothetical protein